MATIPANTIWPKPSSRIPGMRWNTDRDQALNAEAADQTGAANNFVNNSAPNPAWNDLDATAVGYNVPGRVISGHRMRLRNAGWIPTETGTGCGRRATVTSLSRAIRGATCPTSAGCGTTTTASAGAGLQHGHGRQLRMGGCHPWWGRGGAGYGLNIGRAPVGYRSIVMPRAPGGLGRTPPR